MYQDEVKTRSIQELARLHLVKEQRVKCDVVDELLLTTVQSGCRVQNVKCDVVDELLLTTVQSECRVQYAGSRVQGAGSRVQGAGSRVQGPGFISKSMEALEA